MDTPHVKQNRQKIMTTIITIIAVVVVSVIPVIVGVKLLFSSGYSKNRLPLVDDDFYRGPSGFLIHGYKRTERDYALVNYVLFLKYVVRNRDIKKLVRLSYLLSGFFIWGYILILTNLSVRKLWQMI